MMILFRKMLVFLVVASLVAAPLPLAAAQEAPLITHQAVKQALRGQSLTLKAKVTAGGGVQAVWLYYTLSKDAAPFKIAMKPMGLDYYLGTLEGSVLAGVSSLSYYIEAEDAAGSVRETPWQVVSLRDPKPGEIPGPGAPPAVDGPRLSAPGSKKSNGVSLGLIAGGAAAVIGGALLIANNDSGGGGGGDSGTPDPSVPSGVYRGSATTGLTLSGQPTVFESHAITLTIDSKGKILSTTLYEGQSLTDTLDGQSFTLTATVGNPGTNVTGEIFYSGTVVNNRIVGTISGSQSGNPAGPGNYSGSFSATRQ